MTLHSFAVFALAFPAAFRVSLAGGNVTLFPPIGPATIQSPTMVFAPEAPPPPAPVVVARA